MEPVRVKAYGLIPLTKRTYLLMQAFGISFAVSMLLLVLLVPPDTTRLRLIAQGHEGMFEDSISEPISTLLWWAAELIDAAGWILLVLVATGAIETVIMLGRFRRREEEAARQAIEKASLTAPPPPEPAQPPESERPPEHDKPPGKSSDPPPA